MNTAFRLYVLVRLDLAETYRVVQGIHAVVAFQKEHEVTFGHWNNGTVSVLGVRNLKEMEAWATVLPMQYKEFSAFREPDQLGALTAIACYDSGEIFSKLRPA